MKTEDKIAYIIIGIGIFVGLPLLIYVTNRPKPPEAALSRAEVIFQEPLKDKQRDTPKQVVPTPKEPMAVQVGTVHRNDAPASTAPLASPPAHVSSTGATPLPMARGSKRITGQRDIANLHAITPIAGIPLIKFIQKDGKEAMDEGWFEHVAARSKSVPEGQFKPWMSAAETVTGTSIKTEAFSSGGIDFALALISADDDISGSMSPSRFGSFMIEKMSLLFQEDKFQSGLYEKLFHRLGSLKPEYVKAWGVELQRLLDKSVNPVIIACLIVPIDEVFESEQYSSKQAERYLTRLSQVPTGEAVPKWLERIDRYKGSALDAALNIALTDGFFPNERFDRTVFNQAIEQAR